MKIRSHYLLFHFKIYSSQLSFEGLTKNGSRNMTTKVTINDTSINDVSINVDDKNNDKNNDNVDDKNNDNDNDDNDTKKKHDDRTMGIPGSRKTAFMMLLLWGCSIVFRFIGVKWSKVSCSHFVEDGLIQVCLQHAAIYRVTTVTIAILVLQTLFALKSVDFYDFYWIYKYPIFVLGSFALLYPVTYEFSDVSFEWIGRVGGFLFLIFQQLLVLDFAYYFNETLLQKSGIIGRITQAGVDESDCGLVLKNGWLLALLAAASFNFSVFVIAFVLLYHNFSPAGTNCRDNTAIISITFSLMILAVFIQLIGSNGSIITSSILAVYVTYLVYSALTLNPKLECNSSVGFNGGDDRLGPVIIGIVMSFLSIAYAAIVSSKSIAAIMNAGTYSQPGVLSVIVGKQSNSNSGYLGTNLDFVSKLRWTVLNLNFIYILLSFYIAMTLTNWGTIAYNNNLETSLAAGSTSMWITAAAAW